MWRSIPYHHRFSLGLDCAGLDLLRSDHGGRTVTHTHSPGQAHREKPAQLTRLAVRASQSCGNFRQFVTGLISTMACSKRQGGSSLPNSLQPLLRPQFSRTTPLLHRGGNLPPSCRGPCGQHLLPITGCACKLMSQGASSLQEPARQLYSVANDAPFRRLVIHFGP